MASNAVETYRRHYQAIEDQLTGPDWLQGLRQSALAAFSENGLPGRRNEQWKFTSVQELESKPYLPSLEAPAANDPVSSFIENSIRLVVINGRFDEQASALSSLPAGVIVMSLAKAIEEHPELVEPHLGRLASADKHHFPALNTAFMQDGLFVYLPRNAHLEQVLEIDFATRPGAGHEAFQPRNLIVLEGGAQASLIEHWTGTGNYLNNSVTEIVLGDNSHLGHYRYQAESAEAVHISTITPVVGRDAKYDNFTLTTGAKLARNEVHVALRGVAATSNLNGVYLLDGEQHTDTTTHTDHLVEHGNSNQTYKGVIAGKAHAVFQGKIHVHPGAQKTDGYQLNQAILLSDTAQIDSKPELEIYADDVKCSHGATAGQLDNQALFYMRSRGIPEAEARALLIESFLAQAVELVEQDDVREVFLEIMRARLRSL
jgi:Fe-S cluster assembly protein SufD